MLSNTLSIIEAILHKQLNNDALVTEMLEFFGHKQWADRLISIIEEILTEKKVLTPDLGGTAKTSQVGDEVIRKLRES